MALAPVDMESCDKKERCLSGPNIGLAYTPGQECEAGLEFNEATCDCEVGYIINCCERDYLVDYTIRRPIELGNCVADPVWSGNYTETSSTDQFARLTQPGKFIEWRPLNITSQSCSNAGQCDRTIEEALGIKYIQLGGVSSFPGTTTLLDAGLCGVQNSGLFVFEACQDHSGGSFSTGDLVGYAILTSTGGVSANPDGGFILDDIRGNCPAGETFNSLTCDCDPVGLPTGSYVYDGTITKADGSSVPVSETFYLSEGWTFGVTTSIDPNSYIADPPDFVPGNTDLVIEKYAQKTSASTPEYLLDLRSPDGGGGTRILGSSGLSLASPVGSISSISGTVTFLG